MLRYKQLETLRWSLPNLGMANVVICWFFPIHLVFFVFFGVLLRYGQRDVKRSRCWKGVFTTLWQFRRCTMFLGENIDNRWVLGFLLVQFSCKPKNQSNVKNKSLNEYQIRQFRFYLRKCWWASNSCCTLYCLPKAEIRSAWWQMWTYRRHRLVSMEAAFQRLSVLTDELLLINETFHLKKLTTETIPVGAT